MNSHCCIINELASECAERYFYVDAMIVMDAFASIYLFALWAWQQFSIFFGNNFCAVRQTKISMTGLLFSTTRRINRTDSNFGRSCLLGGGSAYILILKKTIWSSFFALACRPNGLIFKYFITTWELMATGSSKCAMTFSAGGHVVACGLDFGEKFPPLKCMAKL